MRKRIIRRKHAPKAYQAHNGTFIGKWRWWRTADLGVEGIGGRDLK
jgi:hypothetical protein